VNEEELPLDVPEVPIPKAGCKVEVFGANLLARLRPWNDDYATAIKAAGGKWDKRAGGYLLPGVSDSLEKLLDVVDCRFDEECRSWIEKGMPDLALDFDVLNTRAAMARPTEELMRLVADHMSTSLTDRTPDRPLPYQVVAASAAIGAGGRFLFGDVMGLGKTIEALTWLSYTGRAALPAVVICTASGRVNWSREARKWLPGDWKIATIDSGSAWWDTEDTDVLVLTYGLISALGRTRKDQKIRPLPPALANVRDMNWKTVIVDEAHRIANWQAFQSKAVRRLGMRSKHFIALSATPVMTSPMNLHGVLKTIAPTIIGNKSDFGARYCAAEYHQLPPPGHEKPGENPRRWWSYEGVSNTAELRAVLAGCMIRRTRSEVRTEIPTIRRATLPVEADAAEYRSLASKTKELILNDLTGDTEKSPADAMKHMMKLWAAIGSMKAEAAVEWATDYCAGRGRPLVVFYHHRAVGDAIASGISTNNPDVRVARIDGTVTGAGRDDIIQRFQAGELEILLASTKAAGESITLTRACDCLIVERQWTAYTEEQAEGRIDRHGQTEPTTATYLCVVAEGTTTLDEDMDELVTERRRMSHEILDPDAVQTNELKTMLVCAERLLTRNAE
jgi:SNF2 family DNA or RNA helicase